MAEMVLVACKLPHGLYLDLRNERGDITHRVKLPGVASFSMPNEDRKFVNPELVNGATITPVDKKLWDEWLKRNADLAVITNGSIFAAAKKDDTVAKIKEMKEEVTGFERINPKKMGVEKLDKDVKKPKTEL